MIGNVDGSPSGKGLRMAEFERTVTVATAPDNAFRFLADPRNLPRYVARMTVAQPEGGNTLRVAAEVEGRHEEGDARFRSDPAARRIEWGAGNSTGYRGWLQVAESGDGASVTIHLHVEREEDEAEIDRVLDETVSNIERLLAPG
jgi:uncharacterized protein YndB with AHSA1/START domain